MKDTWKKRISQALMVVLAVCVGAGMAVLVSGQKTVAPENPLAEPLSRQFTPVNFTPLVEVDEELLQEDAEISDAQSEEAGELGDFGGLPAQSDEKGSIGAITGTTPSAVEGSQYFNVVIDESPTPPKWLDFYVVHYYPSSEYQPEEITVRLNGGAPQSYAPDAELGVQLDGAYTINTVMVSVTYLKPDGSRETPSPVIRRIPLVREALAFNPEPPTQLETTRSTYSFTLTAFYLDAQTNEVIYVTPRVFCGDKEYYQNSEGYFQVPLARGENMVTMQAEARGLTPIEAQTLVTYKAVDVEVNIDPYPFPTLVDDPAFSFRVWLTNADPETRLQVFQKNVEVVPVGDTYDLALDLGFNKIDIIVARPYGGEMLAIYHTTETIEYRHDEIGVFTIEDLTLPAEGPDGYRHTSSNPLLFAMRVFDYKHQPVYQSNITVKVNGELCLMTQEWFGLYEYQVPLVVGANELTLSFRDDLQRVGHASFSLWYDPTEEPKHLGQAQVVIDGSEVGLGIITSGTADLIEGESAAYQIEDVLIQNGFDYSFTGSPKTDFYLAHIISPGITNNVVISEELKEALIQQELWNDTYFQDSLGERDFTNTSGWLVSVGGEAPTRGLSGIYLKDGETLYVRFTLNG